MKQSTQKEKTLFYAGYAAIIFTSILIIIKSFAYYNSGSLSVLASLIDSVMDGIISTMVLASLYYARRPADEEHRWGHGKMEAISALFQAATLTGGGVFLILESFSRIISPTPILHHDIAIIVLLASILLPIIIVLIQRRSLKDHDSLAIEADSANYSGDIFLNLGALTVIVCSYYGAPLWIDLLFALGAAAYMGTTARSIAIKSLDMLLDRELPIEDRNKIIEIIEGHYKTKGWHDLRTHRNGIDIIISFDIEVDQDMRLYDAHEIAKDLENSILIQYPNAEILIHIDPCGYTEDARHRIKGVHH